MQQLSRARHRRRSRRFLRNTFLASLLLAFIGIFRGASFGLPAVDSPEAEETGLIATLKSESATVHDKGTACRRLAVIGTRASVPVLATLLTDETLSHLARFALEPMPDPAAGEALRSALGLLKGKWLVGAINSVGARRDARAVGLLTPLLAAEDTAVVAAAGAALGRVGKTDCAQALQAALARASTNLQPALADSSLVCAEMLLRDGEAAEATSLYDFLRRRDLPSHVKMAATRGAILARGGAGMALLLEQLRSTDADRFAVGLRAARELPGSEVTKALAAEVGRFSTDKQVLVFQALADRADPTVLPTVFEAARSGALPLRLAAVRILPRVAGAAAVPFLLEAAAGAEASLAEAARLSLGRLSGNDADATLVTAVTQGSVRMRCAAMDTVAQRRIVAAIPALLKAARETDPLLRGVALKGLGSTVGTSEFGALADLLIQAKDKEDVAAAEAAVSQACMRITDKEGCAKKLLTGMAQGSQDVKCALVRLLAQLGGVNGLQAVRVASQDSNAQVRDAGIRALADWPDVGAASDLLGVLRSSDSAAHRALAFRGSVRLAREAALPNEEKLRMLTEAMGLAKTTDERKLVLGALGGIATVESLRMATSSISDATLADEAGAAVAKIAAQLDAKYKPDAVAALQQVLKSATAKPVLDEAGRQLERLNKAQ